MYSLKIKSILQLYEEYKILFLKQINQNILTKNIYSFLVAKYEIVNPPRESYFNILKKICEKYNLQYLNLNVKNSLKIINDGYRVINDGLVDSIKYLIGKTGSVDYGEEEKLLLKLLLTVIYSFSCFFFF